MSPSKPAAHQKRAAKPARKSPRRRKTPICPECGSDQVIPVIHHATTLALQRAIEAGRAILADREEWEGMTEWYCKSCGCDWGRHSRRFKKPGGVNATRSD
jgi:hypothetical protein